MKPFIAFAILFLLGACVSVPQHSLQPENIQSFKLVETVFKGEETITSWPSEEANYLKQPGVDPLLADKLRGAQDTNFPELRPYFAKRLYERLAPNFQAVTGSIMNGTRPVKAVITIQQLSIPSTAARVFINNGSSMKATITLIDAKTSEELLKYEGVVSRQTNLGGVSALLASATGFDLSQENNLFANYFDDYRRWLIKA